MLQASQRVGNERLATPFAPHSMRPAGAAPPDRQPCPAAMRHCARTPASQQSVAASSGAGASPGHGQAGTAALVYTVCGGWVSACVLLLLRKDSGGIHHLLDAHILGQLSQGHINSRHAQQAPHSSARCVCQSIRIERLPPTSRLCSYKMPSKADSCCAE